jgi:hypothetical protein
MFNHGFNTNINQSTLDLELKLRNISEDKKTELVSAAHQDCVSGGLLGHFRDERFQGGFAVGRMTNILKPAELTEVELRKALDITSDIYKKKHCLSMGFDRDIADSPTASGILHYHRFVARRPQDNASAGEITTRVRLSENYQLLVNEFKRFYCSITSDRVVFSALGKWFHDAPFSSFLVFQSVIMLVVPWEFFHCFCVYFFTPDAMSIFYRDVLSNDVVVRIISVYEDVDPRWIKVAKFVFLNRFAVINFSLLAGSIFKDTSIAGTRLDFVFGFVKERPLEFIRYSADFFFKNLKAPTGTAEASEGFVAAAQEGFMNTF